MSQMSQVTLITGLPRSGTLSAAQYYDFLHENQFRGEEPTAPPPGAIQSESSSMAVPLLPELKKRSDVRIVHLVRDPDKILFSIHRHGAMLGKIIGKIVKNPQQQKPEESILGFVEPFTNGDPWMGPMLRVIPDMLETKLHDRAPKFMYWWTKWCMDAADERIRLEDQHDWPVSNKTMQSIFPRARWRADNCKHSEWWPKVLELFSEFGYAKEGGDILVQAEGATG